MPSQLVQTLEAAGISTRGLRDADAEAVPIEPDDGQPAVPADPAIPPVPGSEFVDSATHAKARWTGYAILGGLALASGWLLWSSYRPGKDKKAAGDDPGLEGARALKQLAEAVGPGDEILSVEDAEGG